MSANEQSAYPSSGLAMNPLHVLIIDDSDADAVLAAAALSRGGYNIIWHRVDTADGLLEALRERTWHLAISDFTMPCFNGLEALKLLRRHDTDTPFIFVSGT